MREYTVSVAHDAEEGVWSVEDSDIPGLNAEAAAYEDLVAIVLDLAPDLIEANLGETLDMRPSFPVNVVQNARAVRAHG